jgi:hypothetical protein
MTQYVRIEASTKNVVSGVGRPDPVDYSGVPDLRPLPHDGFVYYAWQGRLILSDGPTPTAVLKWDGAGPAWVEVAMLDDLKARKAAAIGQACGDAIVAGFPCNALGDGYTYPSKPNDQANLTGSVLRSFYLANGVDWRTPFWCADADGAWEFRPHTAAQIQQVGDCAMAARLHCMGINEQLQAQIIAAETPADLAEINWPSETP